MQFSEEINVMFLIEHPSRELDAIERLSSMLLKEYGFTSIIAPLHAHRHLVFKYKPDLICVHYCGAGDEYPVNFLKSVFPNAIFLSLNWEVRLAQYNIPYKAPKDNFARNTLFHISWDKQFTDFLLNNSVNSSNIYECGNLQLSSKILDVFEDNKDKEDVIGSSKGWDKIIFLPLNVWYGFASQQDLDLRLRRGFDPTALSKLVKYSRSIFNTICGDIRSIAERNPNFLFIFRPRPNESEAHYIDFLGDDDKQIPDNILISSNHSAFDYFPFVDAVVSNWSTLTFDAKYMGIPSAFYLNHLDLSWLESELFNFSGNTIHDKDTLEQFLCESQKHSFEKEIKDHAMNCLYSHTNALAKLLQQHDTLPLRSFSVFKNFTHLHSVWIHFRNYSLWRLLSFLGHKVYFGKEFFKIRKKQ